MHAGGETLPLVSPSECVEIQQFLELGGASCGVVGADEPKQVLEQHGIAGNCEPALVVEPELLLGSFQEAFEELVAQILGADHEPLSLLPHVHGQAPMRDVSRQGVHSRQRFGPAHGKRAEFSRALARFEMLRIGILPIGNALGGSALPGQTLHPPHNPVHALGNHGPRHSLERNLKTH
ncbi:hypothetical protein Mapa_003459 [Marchantia paleacea]|nr:hypothetical protein Mapa_003459 [Marchantia paleacea]